MTLNMYQMLRSQFELWNRSTYPFMTCDVFTAGMLRHAVTLIFDLLTSYVCHVIKRCNRFYRNRTIHGWVIAIQILKIWGRPTSWIWPEVNFHNCRASPGNTTHSHAKFQQNPRTHGRVIDDWIIFFSPVFWRGHLVRASSQSWVDGSTPN